MKGINSRSLIKEKAVNEICLLGNERNHYIKSVFAEKWQRVEE